MSDISSSDAEKPMEQPEHDLSKAIEQLPVTTENSSENSPSLSDMPIDVVGLIVEKLDYKHQLKLRKVSKSLRALVDNKKPACKSIEFFCAANNVNICFNGYEVMYTKQIYDDEDPVYPEYYETIVSRDDFKEVAFDDLASTLKNPKLQLEDFDFDVSTNFFEKEELENCNNEIQRFLESLNLQLSAKKIMLKKSNLPCFLKVFPYLKPGFLEKFSLRMNHRGDNWHSDGMDQIICSEQWKQAKELEMINSFMVFPLEYATHFKRFEIKDEYIDEDMFARITEFLSKLDNFEQCILWGEYNVAYELLGESVSSNATEEVYHHPILDSDYYFETKKSIDSDEIRFHITKKMRKGNG